MTDHIRYHARQLPFARNVGILVMGLGTLVLFGWLFDIGSVKSVLPGWVTMKANTALAFVLAGGALWLKAVHNAAGARSVNDYPIFPIASSFCAIAVAALGLLTLCEYLWGLDFNIDQLLFAEDASAAAISNPGRMAPLAAISFALSGVALYIADLPRVRHAVELFAIPVFLIGLTEFLVYVYYAYLTHDYSHMAAHTALTFIVLSLGVLSLGPNTGLVALMSSAGMGGRMARRLLPAIVFIPLGLGWLRLEGQHAEWYGTETGTLLFALSNIVVLATIARLSLVKLDRADEQLTTALASAGRLAAIVESSDDAIISKSLDGIITSWNSGAEKLFGYQAAEVIGNPMLILFPPDRLGEEPEILARIARGETVDHFETVRTRKDGTQVDVSVTISPIKDSQGRAIGASKIARDIGTAKQAARKLQAQLARLDLLGRITRAIGARLDLHSIFQIVLRSVEDDLPLDFACMLLYDEAAHSLTVAHVGIGSSALAMQLAMPEHANVAIDRNGLSRCVRGHLVHEADMTQIAMPFPQQLVRGGLRSLVLAPLLVESRVFGVLVAARRKDNAFSSGECEFLRQLSEHVALASHQAQLYDSLQQAYDDLRHNQEMVMQQERLRTLGQMASGIAHDINNAISPITLYTESLLDNEPGLSERARRYLDTIQRAADDVAKTVDRMREFYRQREPQMSLAPVDLNRMVEQVVELTHVRWSNMAQQRGDVINVVTELAPNLPTVMGAENEIREALTNLVFNAVDAMPGGGTLTLRSRLANGSHDGAERHVQVEVGDSGVGMDDETRRRCLEPFFTTKGERGTGLGLAMVYGVVQRHSAGIEIESAVGAGTTVRLSFPVQTGVITPIAADAPPYAIPVGLHILVIDDDPILIKSLRDTLETDGHRVVTAHGGQAGIDAFTAAQGEESAFSVVITDLGMPHVDGRRVAEAVKKAAPSTYVIMLTGWGQRLLASNDVPPYVDALLGKPPTLHKLREALAHRNVDR